MVRQAEESEMIDDNQEPCHPCNREGCTGAVEEAAPCPFSEEIYDTINLCHCCASCRSECIMDI